MRRFHLVVAVLLAVSSGASGQPAPNAVDLWRNREDAVGKDLSAPVVHSPAECAPDAAEPIWSATAALVGYACRHNENG